MPDVCVIGGGPAGIAAAKEASENGARVILTESSARLPTPRDRWHLHISGPGSAGQGGFPQAIERVQVNLGSRAKSVSVGSVHMQNGERVRFDACVLTTGRSPVPAAFPGWNRPGVHLLDSEGAYVDLGRVAHAVDRPVVAGGDVETLLVAQSLSGRGRKTTVILDGDSEFASMGPPVRRALFATASKQGVYISFKRLEKSVGVGRLEAVLAGGEVTACDILAVVPRFRPDIFLHPFATGRNGGYLVGHLLQTRIPGVFAAGSCAELETGPLDGAPAMSGRVAGANASGMRLPFRRAHYRLRTLFGVSLLQAGLTHPQALCMGYDAVAESRVFGESAACSIVFDRRSGSILGVDAVEPSASSDLGGRSPNPWGQTSMVELAYSQRDGSTDISVVTETARQVIGTWRKS